MKKTQNYSRFFALIKPLPGDHEEMKENLVKAFTHGRTISLREMDADEYRRMCDSLENTRASSLSQKDFTAEIKRKRSAVLKRMQKLGIDTSDWAAVDEFCLNSRIAGKAFRQLSLEELTRLVPKLEAIARKPLSAEPVAALWTLDMCAQFPGARVIN
ncbi:MAG: hypothetical protein LBV18_03925 [Alistipes sp.]|jgi:hypothetical protein|nr:hypothetical protein [Alistipes sp.]